MLFKKTQRCRIYLFLYGQLIVMRLFLLNYFPLRELGESEILTRVQKLTSCSKSLHIILEEKQLELPGVSEVLSHLQLLTANQF